MEKNESFKKQNILIETLDVYNQLHIIFYVSARHRMKVKKIECCEMRKVKIAS